MSSSRPPEPWPPSTPEGGYGEPDPDDADTGPLYIQAPSPAVDSNREEAVLPEGGLPGDTRLYTPNDTAWPRHFEPLMVNPRPVRRARKPIVLIGALSLAAVVLGALAFWVFRPLSAPSADPPASAAPVTPSVDSEAQDRLRRLLPAGYPSDSCEPVAATEGVLAQVDCEKNSDPGGPLSAT